MIPILSIVGKSNTGKTTLAEKLIKELKGRGYRVAVIKHAARELDMDRPGTDSSRLAAAGADGVWVTSPRGLYAFRPVERDLALEELLYSVGPGFDVILAEGFKESPMPRIEVHRKVIGGELLSRAEQLVAVVSDEDLDVDAPLFSWEQMGELTDLIESHFLSEPAGEAEVNLYVNQRPLALNLFMVSILTRSVEAMVSVLKGVGEIRDISLNVKKNTGMRRPA